MTKKEAELEEWRAITGYGDHYEASSLGRVRVKDRFVEKRHSSGVIMRQFYKGKMLSIENKSKHGHLSVHIGFDGRKVTVGVHRLVLLAFTGPCPEGMEGCHNNGDASDNRPDNLRWDTHYENNQDRLKHGRYARGGAHVMAKLTIEQVRAIRASENCAAIAKKLGINYYTAWGIRAGYSWRGVE